MQPHLWADILDPRDFINKILNILLSLTLSMFKIRKSSFFHNTVWTFRLSYRRPVLLKGLKFFFSFINVSVWVAFDVGERGYNCCSVWNASVL